jgi:hypothetical protein
MKSNPFVLNFLFVHTHIMSLKSYEAQVFMKNKNSALQRCFDEQNQSNRLLLKQVILINLQKQVSLC